MKETKESAKDLFSAQFQCVLRDHQHMDLQANASYQPMTPAVQLDQTFKQAASLAIRKQRLQESLNGIFRSKAVCTLPKPHLEEQDGAFLQESQPGEGFEA